MKHLRRFIGGTALTRSIALMMTALTCTSVMAEVGELRFTMTSIEDVAYGEDIIAGNYKKAIEKITTTRGRVDAFMSNTNLCVAYTKLGDTSKAPLACDAAVNTIESRNVLRNQDKKTYRTYLSVALMNRGVLRVAMGEVELARQDFDEALDLKVGDAAAEINLARLAEFTGSTARY